MKIPTPKLATTNTSSFLLCSGIGLLLLLTTPASGAEPMKITVGDFAAESLRGWEEKSFSGKTDYQLITEGKETVVKATSQAAASGLFKKQRIDLQQTPYLNWRWRVDKPLHSLDEQTKSGDDYGARIYVVVDGGLFFWKTKAINYVWASSSPKGKSWPNAFAGKSAMMLALRSSTDEAATWYQEKRNVAADLKEFFGTEIRYIDAIAIMTDTDNSGQETSAQYGDIFFSGD
ncbi:MAG: DUF3047 domain-containing protein [Proteobacteria bacterium]|nr:DUF3047 domain-containing protein [Pseudomonadota bacterium]